MLCQTCLTSAPTQFIHLEYNVGLLICRLEGGVRGNLCKRCIHKKYWLYSLINFFLGWWGFASFLFTLIFGARNTYRYIGALSLEDEGVEDEPPPELTADELTQLRKHLDFVVGEIQADRPLPEIAEDLVEKLENIPVQKAALFVHLVQREGKEAGLSED